MPHYPHLLIPGAPEGSRYTSTGTNRNRHTNPGRDRAPHAAHLRGQLTAAAAQPHPRQQRADGNGFFEANALMLSFESDPGFLLRFESLDLQSSGIELLSVTTTADGRNRAVVRVPYDKVNLLLRRLDAYQNADPNAPIPEGKTRKPNDHATLLESIVNIRQATLEALWSDPPADYPGAQTPITWEVWLRGGRPPEDQQDAAGNSLTTLAAAATSFGYEVVSPPLYFVDRTVVLVRGTREQLSGGVNILTVITEVRRAKELADFFVGLEQQEQHDWIAALRLRLTPPPADAPIIGLLDTGLNHGHPLLADIINPETDLHTYTPAWGKHDADPFHGTPMAGLALYGDLAPLLASDDPIVLSHGLQSVKLINKEAPHEPRLYGIVTQESVTRLEVVSRRRIYCMAITADGKDRGRPTSWSSAVDDLAFGTHDGVQRLILLSAGNLHQQHWPHYPDANIVASIQDPAQSWNAVTVGGYTDKVVVNVAANPDWQPLAVRGDLAPSSTTSVTWTETKSKPPYKPDIVLEAGNRARHAASGDLRDLDELQLLTTNHRFALGVPPLTTIGETSGATALAAKLTAELASRYPQFWPETLRGLLIHSADWTDAMRARCKNAAGAIDYDQLLRTFGYGVPNRTALFASASNQLTLIVQDSLQPFFEDEDKELKTYHMKLHALPWPVAALQQLPLATDVTLRVTLSYFIEPSPGERGWDRRYGYPSHGLRFALKRALEDVDEFRARINKFDQDDDYKPDSPDETGRWLLGSRPRYRGSIHSNSWTGPAADLANRACIAVYPTLGWWRTRKKEKRYERSVRYSLVATIQTPPTDINIYTPVAALIGIANPVEIIV